MLRSKETKIAKEKVYDVRKPINIWHLNIQNKIISKLIDTKSSSKYLIGYLDKVIKPVVFMLSKLSEYGKTFMEIKIKLIN